MTDRKITGIGETVLDIVIKDGQALAAVPGGSTFNSMVSLGRTLGKKHPEIKLTMITQTGNDQVGALVTDFMKKNRLDISGVKLIDGRQSVVSLALLNEHNDACYEFFRDSAMPPFKAGGISFKENDIVVFGSFFAVGKSTRDEVQGIVRCARDAGAIIFYDINFRKSHSADLDEVKRHIEENCRMADIVKGSEEDLSNVWGGDDIQSIYEEHIKPLCSTLVCTRGAKSTECFSPESRCSFEVPPIQTVSTIGAGDNFNAGIVYGIADMGYDKKGVSSIKEEDWIRIIPQATRFSANVCQSIYNYVDEDFINKLTTI